MHHLQQIWHFARSETLAKESLPVGDVSTTAWRSTIFETVTYFEVVVAEQGMAVDPPERDERERRPREERAIGSARCKLLQYLFMYFSLYIITYLTFVYQYIFCLVHIYLWYRWVQQVPEWVGQQFYRHGLFCASQVILSPNQTSERIE